MATKPENQFRSSVHRYISKRVYQEKTNNTYRGGIPDDYYESNGKPGSLWVEYKYTPKIQRELCLTAKHAKPKLSALQEEWLDRAYRNGQQVAVIIGCPKGGVILTDREWLKPITAEDFEANLKSRQELMAWIEDMVTKDGYKRRSVGNPTTFKRANTQPELPEQDAVPGLGHLCDTLHDGEQIATD
jgi:hypothetical protein